MENLDYLKVLDDLIIEKCKSIDILLIDKFRGDENTITEVKDFIKKMILANKSIKGLLLVKASRFIEELAVSSYVDEKFDEYFLNN
jgi:hypothetical protein